MTMLTVWRMHEKRGAGLSLSRATCGGGAGSHLGVHAQQGVGPGVELLLQGDDDELHALLRLLPDEAGHLETFTFRAYDRYICRDTHTHSVTQTQ